MSVAIRRAHVALWLALLLAIPQYAFAQTAQAPVPIPATPPPNAFYRAEVLKVLHEERSSFNFSGGPIATQRVKIKVLNGPQEGQEREVDYNVTLDAQKVATGDTIVLVAPGLDPGNIHILETYRLPALIGITVFFLLLIIIFAGRRGAMSILGLVVSILVLTLFVVPQIMAGKNPLLISLLGALVIATLSLYLAHGFSRRTTVAWASTLITISIAMLLAVIFVNLARLLGLGSEEAWYLQSAPISRINLKGLLLGGIIVGALGVLDDITTAQAAAVDEISKANPALSPRELFRRGLSVGREHITSLVNTLVLAYAGASFPALLLFTAYERPLWVVLNTELIAEEIVRTLVGSMALMCAVPITTLLAAHFLSRHHLSGTTTAAANKSPGHTHVH